ncbi:MAG: glutamate-5-semialdehyde dehydrogenase [Candidatus Nanopelagicales bacterium]|nr:glutamate-5-semialdehyde dehydrogenase [Actinomycetota bacterium]HNE88453.1 glutamate-5-semialdehyde dehydrogenase [Actinomycetota bacterium]HNL52464.1 glutamate-5-semialdehyde dehydrogenase [Actinomycetota bacterium]HNO15676.1 glutamate-5-semialdehyde dehydrogenase [Actinomycetota bacterium]HUM86352.1 glutamate-5-semialdehyde dehydrogenase [Actinomycetota bacterium]
MTHASAEEVRAVGQRARAASAVLRTLHRDQKDAALLAIADALIAHTPQIIEANHLDVQAAEDAGTDPAIIDRLTLTEQRLADIAAAVRQVAALPDPVGDVLRGYTLPNGLKVRQVRVPLGVVGMIYEARPNVTVDAAVLCLKSGNAALLRGSASAAHSNTVLVDTMRAALADTDVPVDAICQVPGLSHDSVGHLTRARGIVDVVIPRGGAGLIQSVVKSSLVPVIETGVGNCHVYLHEDAPLDRAVEIVVNSKTHRVSVCNAAETLLVHHNAAERLLPAVFAALKERGVTVHGDEVAGKYAEQAGIAFRPVTDLDWAEEYLSLDMAVGVVADLDAAIAHIARWSSGHTEAIVADSVSAIDRFTAAIDSAAIMVNASTRFTDGEQLGFGAEIGISTQKLHARGPMGLAELTSTKFLVEGDGHIRA